MQISQEVEGLDGFRETVRKPSKPSSVFNMRHDPPAECDIERLLQWAYGKQQVHAALRERERGAGSAGAPGGMDSVVKVQMNWINGGRISGGGLPPGLPHGMGAETVDVHPDAIAVHRQVVALDSLSVGLLINHGCLGTRPDAGGPLQKLEAKRNRKGRAEMMTDNNRNAIGVLLDPEALAYNATVMHLRAVYEHWFLAMLQVRAAIVELRVLPHLTVKRPFCPVSPWLSAGRS